MQVFWIPFVYYFNTLNEVPKTVSSWSLEITLKGFFSSRATVKISLSFDFHDTAITREFKRVF